MSPLNAPIVRPCRSARTVLLLVLAAASCTTTGNAPGEQRWGSGAITRAELDGSSFLSAHNAIEQLRPTWLRPRAAPTLGTPTFYPVVYVDGMRWGQLDELRSIGVSEVITMEYMSPNDATTRFGIGHTSGAILVTTSL